ncbi:2'-5' RNA ligase family protein [Nonomuraea ceibae]|uniref:2'-5' RNA ligase family protein n=1 Tax=Nonomuraea ceibae TaxID=1935170 RepID=UPI001C5DB8C3|nr:2'-5' RNA ligase family protein [Nonomuraea ceibae]
MPDEGTGKGRAGESALLAVVKEAEPFVAHWRRRFDSFTETGVPAHVTVLVPFLDAGRIDAATERELGLILGAHAPFAVRFERCGRFPEVLYLEPAPGGPFRELTGAVVKRWPEAPPYGGQFAEVVPHLTVAHGQDERVLGEVEAEVSARLPFAAQVTSISLYVSDGDRWHERAEFPLLG